ncbi:serine hydrolase (plasmid) [Pontibacillus sp. ALD_SL1]|uniref:serine hydrolase n=1 Tax=Pontibacillus sp. ALD_SL1 TaxID=2777185 RepID=UPI001A9793CE|nr:serine hydrolase [Pontibacillus sp. ALD_SL1]QST02667.1 serine hydrolase [Pontibacillus sp. ALD_SL1]
MDEINQQIKTLLSKGAGGWANLQTLWKDHQHVQKNEGFSRFLGDPFGAFLKKRTSAIGVCVYDLGRNKMYAYNGDHVFGMNETVMVPIAYYLLTSGTKVEEEHVKHMMRDSDHEAASSVWKTIGGKETMNGFFNSLNLYRMDAGDGGRWEQSVTTPGEMTECLRSLYYEKENIDLLRHMKQGRKEQRWGITAGNEWDQVYLKNGWKRKDWNDWCVSTTGIVKGENPYVLSFYTENNPSLEYGILTIETINRMIVERMREA